VLEPSRDEAVQILQGLKSRYEEHHGVTYSEPALEAAVDLSSKHLVDRHLPDKAIDVIDEAGALQRDEARERAASGDRGARDRAGGGEDRADPRRAASPATTRRR